MDNTSDSIVVKRLVRNLRYRQTYIQAFGSFLQPEPHPEAVRLLHALIDAQQFAVVLLTGYLQDVGVAAQGLPLVQRLLDHASSRKDLWSRMRFVHHGLSKATSWYKEQLKDGQMTADPKLRQLLFELGEREAASLWRTEATMVVIGMRRELESKERTGSPRPRPDRGDRWGGERPAIQR
jgi:hypothetical protein